MLVSGGARTRPSRTQQLRGFGGSWEDWCDKAANAWPGSDREDLRAKCKAQPYGPASFDPATTAGHVTRGLPANFSTDPKVVAGGEGGALMKDAGQVISTVSSTVGGASGQTSKANVKSTASTTVSQGLAKVGSGAKKYWPYLLGGFVLLGGFGFALTRRRPSSPAPAPALPPAAAVAGYRRRRKRHHKRRKH